MLLILSGYPHQKDYNDYKYNAMGRNKKIIQHFGGEVSWKEAT
jgi:hypothetical protein